MSWQGGTFPTLPKVYPDAIANKTEDTFSRSELEEAIRKNQLTRISAKESAEIIGVSPSLVIRWASEGCPYSDGKTIKRFSPTTNLRNGAKSRNGVTYDREEIGEIANKRREIIRAATRGVKNPSAFITYLEAKENSIFPASSYMTGKAAAVTWEGPN